MGIELNDVLNGNLNLPEVPFKNYQLCYFAPLAKELAELLEDNNHFVD